MKPVPDAMLGAAHTWCDGCEQPIHRKTNRGHAPRCTVDVRLAERVERQKLVVDGDTPGPIRFTVFGRPVGYKRVERGANGKAYTPKGYKQWRNSARRAAHRYQPDMRWPSGGLWLCAFVFLPPLKTVDRPQPTGTRDGDWDNYGKGICDALQHKAKGVHAGWGLYRDDAQIVQGYVWEAYDPHAATRMEVVVGPSSMPLEVTLAGVPVREAVAA